MPLRDGRCRAIPSAGVPWSHRGIPADRDNRSPPLRSDRGPDDLTPSCRLEATSLANETDLGPRRNEDRVVLGFELRFHRAGRRGEDPPQRRRSRDRPSTPVPANLRGDPLRVPFPRRRLRRVGALGRQQRVRRRADGRHRASRPGAGRGHIPGTEVVESTSADLQLDFCHRLSRRRAARP